MSNTNFPALPLAAWQPTRTSLHNYAKVLGEIRHAYAPRQKHSFHGSLYATATGLTTTPIPFEAQTFELQLDFTNHRALISTSAGGHTQITLRGQSISEFYNQVLNALADIQINLNIKRELFSDTTTSAYDTAAIANFWSAFAQIDSIFKTFRGELRSETSPVQLWPHGFDLAMLWFSGRIIPGKEDAKPRDADEQMNFGFSTGDAGIPEPYFYVTAYPLPADLPRLQLPPEAYWHNQGWQGAILKYQALVKAPDPAAQLLTFLRTVQRAGAKLMTARFDHD